VPAGSTDFVLTATGGNFEANAQILWNGSASGVTMLPGGSSTVVSATISHANVAFGTLVSVTVANPGATGGGSSAQSLTVTATPPANDNFARAIPLSSSGTNTVDNSSATTEATDPTPPCVADSVNSRTKTVWWSSTPSITGTVEVDTIGSAYDTTLSAWTGTIGNLTLAACNDDIVQGSYRQSQVTFSATAGTQYYFMVAPFGPPESALEQYGGKTVINVSNVAASILSASPATQVVNAGGSATFQITNTSTATIPLSCAGLPMYASCAPVTVGPNASAALVISTTATRGAVPFSRNPAADLWPRPPLPILVAFLFGAFALFRCQTQSGRRLGALLLVLGLSLCLVECGGGSVETSSSTSTALPGTPAGSYMITVAGYPVGGGIQSSTIVNLQVN